MPPRQQSALLNAFGLSDEAAESRDIWLVALATLTLLTEGANHKPILLVVDDAQWLDEATREVLSFVSRRLSSDSIVLLLALREGFDLPFGDADTLRHVIPALGDADAVRLLDIQAPGLSAESTQPISEEKPPAIHWRWWSCRAACERKMMRRPHGFH